MEAQFTELCSIDDREEWLRRRREGIGSSDAAAILGISPFKSALEVYVDKIQEREDSEETEAMKWGRILEPLIIQEFARETSRIATPNSLLLQNKARPWMLATLDGLQNAAGRTPEGILEIKATGYRVGDWDEEIPAHVMAQCQHQLAVTGKRWGSVAVLQRGCKLLWADFARDESFIDEILIPAEEEFWKRVENREPVDPDGSRSARQALKALYPKVETAFVDLPGKMVQLDSVLQALKSSKKAIQDEIDLAEQKIIAAIGPAEIGYLVNGVSYSYKLKNRKEYTAPATSYRELRRHEGKK